MLSPVFSLTVKKSSSELGFGVAFRWMNGLAAILLFVSAFISWPPFWLALILGLVALGGAGYTEKWTFGCAAALYQNGWGPFLRVKTWNTEHISRIILELPTPTTEKGSSPFVHRLLMETENQTLVLEVLKGEGQGEKLTLWGKQIAAALGKEFVVKTQ